MKGFIPKPVAQSEYGTVYQHQGMLLQNLHRCYLYTVIRLPKLKDVEQRILMFLNPNLTSDDIKLNDNAFHQKICTHFKVNYLEEMDIIKQSKGELKRKLMGPYRLLYPTKSFKLQRGWQLLQVLKAIALWL